MGDTVTDANSDEAGAGKKRTTLDVGDAIRNSNVDHAAERECICSNGGHRITVRCIGNHHITARSGVTREGGSAVVDRERELRLHHGGQQQHRSQQAKLNQVALVFHFPVSFIGSLFPFQVKPDIVFYSPSGAAHFLATSH